MAARVFLCPVIARGQDNGPCAITGTVAIAGTPDASVWRRVSLLDRPSGRIVRQIWSNPANGSYAFGNIRRGPWTILAIDHTNAYNAVVADNILGTPQ